MDGDPDLVSFAKQLAKRKVSVQGNRSVFKRLGFGGGTAFLVFIP